MEIREYMESDVEGVVETHTESVRGVASEDYSEEELDVWASKDPEDVELEESQVRFVAEKGGQIIGFSEYNGEEKELSGLYVKPDFTGQGIGKKLLQKAEKHAKKQGVTKLSCYSTITAKEFYQNNGYEVIEETTYEMEDQNLKVYKMEKEL